MTRIIRILAAVAALIAGAVGAAPLSERSPFAQGHWWNAAQPGSGFDMFSAGGQAVVNWYTYDRAGKPVWYTAQGDAATIGRDAWPLLKHHWANGRKASPVVAGGLRLTLVNAEVAQIDWNVEGASGSIPIVPFVQAGAIPEVDHTGSWFAPDNDGWGFAVTQQGDVLGGVLFTYDALGEPTWASGFGRTSNIQLYKFTGACPACSYVAPVATSVGQVSFDFPADWQASMHSDLRALLMAPGVNTDGAKMFQLSRPASSRPADRQLAAFDSAASLKSYLDAGMLNLVFATVSTGGADFSAAPPAPPSTPYSTTNLQESGVDEADTLKFDGRFAYAYRHLAAGPRDRAIRIMELGADGTSVTSRATVSLSGTGTPVDSAGLYLSNGKLVSVTGTVPRVGRGAAWAPSNAWANGQTQVEIFDASGGNATSRWSISIDGHPVASRRIGDRLYVITRFVPSVPGFAFGLTGSNSASNVSLLASTPLDAMLPKVRFLDTTIPAVKVGEIHAPPLGSTRPFADLIVVTAIDIANPHITQSLAIVGAVETVYMSPRNLYLATTRQDQRAPGGELRTTGLLYQLTDVHQVALGENGMSVVGSGTIEGILGSELDKTPFRLSEDQGKLRVVTSATMDMGWGMLGNRNRLTILEPSAIASGVLRTVAAIPNAAHPEALGLPFEELYATRFLGDRLYAVTFTSARFVGQAPSVDPLYVVDLSKATDPRIRGELVIPGFSDYLHPLANGMLLGFGRSVTTSGAVQGLQLSLFDVTDDTKPRAIQQIVIGKRGSDSALLQSHHALSVLPTPDGSVNVAFPARIHDGSVVSGSGELATYAWKESGLARYLVTGSTPTTARLLQLPSLVTQKLPTFPPGPDDAANGARSILFPASTVYMANGQFWRQDPAGNVSGPF